MTSADIFRWCLQREASELKYGRECEIIRIIRCETSSNAMLNLMMTISNQVLKAIHLVIHWKHVIKYLKWDRKMRNAKKENI